MKADLARLGFVLAFLQAKESTVSQRLRLLLQLHVVTVTDRFPYTYSTLDPAMCAALARQTAGLHAHLADPTPWSPRMRTGG